MTQPDPPVNLFKVGNFEINGLDDYYSFSWSFVEGICYFLQIYVL